MFKFCSDGCYVLKYFERYFYWEKLKYDSFLILVHSLYLVASQIKCAALAASI